MSQLPDQTDLQTDAYSMGSSASSSAKSGLNTNQKKMVGISAAALLLGGSAWAISRKITERNEPTPANETDSPEMPSDVDLPTDVDVAGKITDTMSFEQAFEAARKEVGMGGLFSWHGRWYNTFEKEEWSGLSLQQRQEYAEMITGEKLPVKPYIPQIAHAEGTVSVPTAEIEPTIIEGHINGQRIMGLDFDQDGVIDTLVMEGADGYTYRVVDASGDNGLDTLLRYDSLSSELVEIEKIDEPFVLSNNDFSQGLEESMSKEVVDSILEPDASAPTLSAPDEVDVIDEPDHDNHLVSSYEPDDDTYVNNGDVQDLDE